MLSHRLHCVPDCFSFIPEADHGSTLLLYCVCGLVLSMKAMPLLSPPRWFGLRMAGRTMTSVANTGRHVSKHRCCSSVSFVLGCQAILPCTGRGSPHKGASVDDVTSATPCQSLPMAFGADCFLLLLITASVKCFSSGVSLSHPWCPLHSRARQPLFLHPCPSSASRRQAGH